MIYKAKQPTDVLGQKNNQIATFIPLVRLQLFKNFNPQVTFCETFEFYYVGCVPGIKFK